MNNFVSVDILLVEDNLQDAELAIRALNKNNLSNHIVVVDNGVDALDFLFCRGKFKDNDSCYKPKVVFLDLKLPKLSGLEVLKVIKQDEELSKIPVVIVTSSREDPDISEAYKFGANSYVVKPIDFDQFKEVIRNLGYYWLVVNQSK